MKKSSRRSTQDKSKSRQDKFAGFKTDALAWLQSLRFSALSVVVLAVVATAAIVLAPNISVFVQQKKEIAQLRESVNLHKKAVDETEAEKLKWQDPVFIKAQARERLYYVMPGETQLSVITDGVEIPVDDDKQVSDSISQTESNWPLDFAKSIIRAGTTADNPKDFF
ncbi:MAG TPA: septum formation initiator family protein [Microbacteriaceae bacterium]|nr:septum formation initiator family protein [Microbacteriaceae bacterium]